MARAEGELACQFDSRANCQQHGFVSASAFDSMDNCHQAEPDALADPSADLLPCVPFDSMVNCQRLGTMFFCL